MSKYLVSVLGLTSLCLAITGGILLNPFLIGAGVAGLFLSCGVAVSMKKPQNITYV